MEKKLRPYQENAISAIHKGLEKGIKNQILCLPTGAGKTFTAVKAIQPFGRKLWATHTSELLDQSGVAMLQESFPKYNVKEMIQSHGGLIDFVNNARSFDLFKNMEENEIIEKVGIIKAETFKTSGDIVLASVQTLHRRLDKIKPDEFDVVVLDECHMACAVTIVKSLNYFQPKLNLGLTATPHRGDGMLLGDIYDQIIYQYNIADAVKDGYLVELDAIQVKTQLDLDGVRTTAGEFNQKDLKETVNTPARNKLIVEKYKQYADGLQNLVFCVDVEHAQNMCEAFKEAGYKAEFIVGDTELSPDRNDIIDRFKTGKTTVLCNVMILTAGFDYPGIQVVTMACLDSNTEILTPDGWKNIDDDFDEVISYNIKSKSLENKKITSRIWQYWDKGMINILSGQYDIRVTDNHRMLVGLGRKDNDFVFTNANHLLSKERFRLPVSGNELKREKEIDLSDDELRFIAWFMTDGGFVSKNCIVISQAKTKTKIIIKELLIRLKYKFGEYERKNNRSFGGEKALLLTSFRIPRGIKGKAKGKGWNKLIKYLDKNLSDLLIPMSRRQFTIFWEELLLGDGNNDSRKDRKEQLIICNNNFLSKLQAIAIMCGFATNATFSQKTTKGNNVWLMSISDRKYIEIKTNDKRSDSPSVFKEKKVLEKVWCVENENKTIVIRRNGSVSIVGNCPTKSLTKFIQQVGRPTRTLPGVIDGIETAQERISAIKASAKPKAIILDVVDTTTRHRLINTWELDKAKPIEERTFITSEKKFQLIEAREKRKFEAVTKKDTRIDLLQLPKVKQSNSIRMTEPATEKQLAWIARLGYDIVNINYTKAMASEIISNQSASEKQIAFLKWKKFDCSNGVTVAEAALAFDLLKQREAAVLADQAIKQATNNQPPMADLF